MKFFTSDTHFARPFVAALRGFIRPEYQEYSANDLVDPSRVLSE